jgi:small subunit ribosomal protein S16
MQRTGRINSPSYRLIVVEHTESPKTGKIVERVGTYNPITKDRKVDADRVRHWMSVGAQPSDTVHNMLVTIGILNTKKKDKNPKKNLKKDEEAAAAAAATSAAVPAAEAPAAEALAAEEKKAE